MASPLVERLAARLAVGPATVGGVWGSSHAYLTAEVLRKLPRPALVVVSTPEEAVDDLSTFLSVAPALLPEAGAGELAHAERLKIALGLKRGTIPLVVATPKSAKDPLPDPALLEASRLHLAVGGGIAPEALAERLVASRFERVHAVERPGEFAVRGGIVDLHPLTADHPVRLDFFGDRIESIRMFRVTDQQSIAEAREIDLDLAPPPSGLGAAIADFLPREGIVILRDPEPGWIQADRVSLSLLSLPAPDGPAVENARTLSLQRFSGRLGDVARELADLKGRVVVTCLNEGEERRLRQLLEDAKVSPLPEIIRGRLTHGFTLAEEGLTWLPHNELFNRTRLPRPMARRSESRPLDSLLELEKGDIVVHLAHGIGRFIGIERLENGEFVALEYDDHAKVYVPVANIDLIQKYVGGSDGGPRLSKLGTEGWSAAKLRTEEAVRKLAAEMIQVQAVRQMELGIAYPADTDWQRAFEAAFPYEETPDQTEVMRQIKLDMQSPRPMDRLICGDVGYGKTELAMRAAFKAATFNKQVAVLVPTTVLAQQHLQTFRDRMAEYPVTIDVLSRFRRKADQKKVLKQVAAGKVDILIGTHRLLQNDVVFKDLGLVIIDEEQRFGVEHKERLKHLRATVDVLTLTATPIPRTMHLSLLGLREISSLTTPPRDRRAIRTEIVRRDDRIIREALMQELDRDGQIFFVHNRVHSIDRIARHLERIVPEASFGIGHGQMEEDELEKVMIAFLEKKLDVLVCTTIIESGLDIPSANTILIDDADRYGLADLHQLRGRVGRYTKQAHCLLLLPTDRKILAQAQKRLKAIEEFSDLGGGFKIAMRDLEIRGVGNLLGREQHGHINAVGYDLYVKMLANAVKRMKRQEVDELPESAVDLGFEARVPEDYITDLRSRVEVYRRIVACRDAAELEGARKEIEDRFGPPPPPVENFLLLIRVKQLARRHRLSNIALGSGYTVATYLDRAKAQALQRRRPGEFRVVDDRTAHIYQSSQGPGLARDLIKLME